MVMRRLSGQELFEFLEELYSSPETISSTVRLKLTLALLKAYIEQVPETMIHRDLKPENIFIDYKNSSPNIKIFDFGLATRKQQLDNKYPFSLPYAAPEQLLGVAPTTDKVDAFSMARILCLVWSIDTKDFFFPQKEQYKYLKNSQNVNLEGLFQGLDDLDDIDKKNIHTLLAAMHLNDPEQRLSIPQAFKLFSKIELGCKKDITACYAEEVAPNNDEQPSSSWWIDALTGVFNTVVDILEEVRFIPQASNYGHSFSYF